MIVTTMNDGFETAEVILEDLKSGALEVAPSQLGAGPILQKLHERGNGLQVMLNPFMPEAAKTASQFR